jgi:hypothetical protein
MKQQYLRWVIDNTKTVWWHDSVEPERRAEELMSVAITHEGGWKLLENF